MCHFHNLSQGKQSHKIAIRPIITKIKKRVAIVCPILFINSLAAFAITNSSGIENTGHWRNLKDCSDIPFISTLDWLKAELGEFKSSGTGTIILPEKPDGSDYTSEQLMKLTLMFYGKNNDNSWFYKSEMDKRLSNAIGREINQAAIQAALIATKKAKINHIGFTICGFLLGGTSVYFLMKIKSGRVKD